MDLKNEIKSLIAKQGLTLKSVCQAIEQKSNKKFSPNNITNKFKRGTIKYKEVKDILEVLDYHIEFVENK